MSFDEAVFALERGKRVARYGWPVWLTMPFKIIMVTSFDGELIEWTPTDNDKLAIDWIVEGGRL